jgi:alpha-amylase
MVSTCFYFQVHQPYRLKNYTVFDIGKNSDYFNHRKNKAILHKVAAKCYLPANNLMHHLIDKHPEFKISYSFSGTVLEQLEQYAPEVIDSFKQLVDTGNVEVLDETYYHSLAFLYSKKEFREQVRMHRNKVNELFDFKPKVFRNTELIYNNELAAEIEDMGYRAILAEGADHVLGWKSPNFVYTPKNSKIALLLKNYKLSDDIAFRFSDPEWKERPLTVEKYARWLNAANGNGNVVNLFMDYETFGEHQWSSTGIFNFMKSLPGEILKHPDNNFMTPSEVAMAHAPAAELDIPFVVSWADLERDVSAWLGNKMQQASIKKIYDIEQEMEKVKDIRLVDAWRKLQTSDHFYYMCTKWFSDGDVHKYFNPYDSPYDAFIAFMNIFNDLNLRIKEDIMQNTPPIAEIKL